MPTQKVYSNMIICLAFITNSILLFARENRKELPSSKETQALLNNKSTFVRNASGKLERPENLFVNGKQSYLCAVADVNIYGLSVSESYVFKIKWD